MRRRSQTPVSQGARIVKEDFYVDDLLTGEDTEEEVMKIKEEVTSLLKLGGLKARETIEFSDGEE